MKSTYQNKDWDSLSAAAKAEVAKVAIQKGIYSLDGIKNMYNEFADGGNINKEKPVIVPFRQKTEVIITPDSEYNHYLNTLPDNQRFTPNDKYDSYLYWKLNGKPRNFKEAYDRNMFHYNNSDNLYHANSIAWGDDGVGYFMKPKTHNTVGYELDWFNKGLITEEDGHQRPETPEEKLESDEFRKNYMLIDDPVRTNYYRYQPIEKAKGGSINIKQFAMGGDTSNTVPLGRRYWQAQSNTPTILEKKNTWVKQQKAIKDRENKALRKWIQTEGVKELNRKVKDYLTTSNDNTWTTANRHPKNPHLQDRVTKGAKAHASWEKEHPVLNTWGNVLGAVPFAVASAPLVAAAGSGMAALGDAVAATSAGQAITAGLAPLATAASTNIAGTPLYTWADVGLSSLFGAHGIQTAINEGGISPTTALELLPVTRAVKPAVKMGLQEAKEVVDNGSLWDAYTTFGGRLGNYGDNIFTNIYGTAARRFGLPDKARIPADAMRKIKGNIHVDNGVVDLTGNKTYLGNPHVNATLDRGVVSHSKGQWDGANTYITPTSSFIDQAQGSLKSIEPSDMFSNGARITEIPKNVTLISGDVESLNKARESGMQTLSSPKLRRIYNEGLNEYKLEKEMFDEQYANATGFQKRLLKEPENPKYRRWWPEYTKEIQRLQSQRGTPTLADFRLLEQQTGLKSGVTSMLGYDKAIRQLETMKSASIHDITNGKVQPYVYPNGRIVDWDKAAEELELIRRAKYNNVFYDPASYVENDWQVANEVIKNMYNEFAMGGDTRKRMPAHPRNREDDPEAFDAAQQWKADMQQRRQQQEEQNKAYVEEKFKRNTRAAEEFNRHKDTVMSALSDIANSAPFTGSEVNKAAETQRQEKLDKWHDVQNGIDAAMTVGEFAAAGYGVARGLTHFNRLLARKAIQSTGQAISREAIKNLVKWNKRVAAIDRPQVLMSGIGGAVDGYQWMTANNSFDKWENGIETGADLAGVVGGMNWFRNLPYLRRIGGNKIDAVLDGLGYGAATWDIVKHLPPLSGILENIKQQSEEQ